MKVNNLLLLLLLVNTFRFKEKYNSLSKNNNNNNLLSEELNSNIIVLVNTLIGLNLIGGYFLREGNFVKLIEFVKTEIKDFNK